MPADRDASSALLYLPSEALVRATVEGDGDSWSESLGYVPDEALVADVLRRSDLAERPLWVFRFPASITSPISEQRRPVGFRRAAAAVAAALGVSPSALAAATVVHVLASVAFGPLVFQQVGGPAMPPSVASPIEAPRIVYWLPRAPAPRAGRKPSSRVNYLTIPLSTARGSSGRIVIAYDSPKRPPNDRGNEARGLDCRGADTSGLRQEFLLEGAALRIAGNGGRRMPVLVRLLRMQPGARLRISGAGPVVSPDDSLRKGRREAEAFERVLLSQGIDSGRLELDIIPLGDQTCAVNEPLCARGRSRVVTQLIRP